MLLLQRLESDFSCWIKKERKKEEGTNYKERLLNVEDDLLQSLAQLDLSFLSFSHELSVKKFDFIEEKKFLKEYQKENEFLEGFINEYRLFDANLIEEGKERKKERKKSL